MGRRLGCRCEQQGPLGEKFSGVVEVDETYIGVLVERDGDVRSIHHRTVTEKNLKDVVRENVAEDGVRAALAIRGAEG